LKGGKLAWQNEHVSRKKKGKKGKKKKLKKKKEERRRFQGGWKIRPYISLNREIDIKEKGGKN